MRLHPGGICIRPVMAEDLQVILALLRQLAGRTHRPAGAWLTQVFEGLLKGGTQEGFVAVLHQRVIGFVSLYYMKVLRHGGMVASVQELAVTEELRGRGVGKALIDFARKRAGELRCTGFEVACDPGEIEQRRAPVVCRPRQWARPCGVHLENSL